MTEIRIPFLPEFKERLLNGQKTATTRTRKYGEKGDTFKIFDAEFEITQVGKTCLYDVASNYYREEGFTLISEFVDIWKRIHPRRGFQGTDNVWVHFFKKKVHQKTQRRNK